VLASEIGGWVESGVDGGDLGDRGDRLEDELIKPPSSGDTSLNLVDFQEDATRFYKGRLIGLAKRVGIPCKNLCRALLAHYDNNAPVCLLY
jgi:hypothetical protein